MSSQAADRCKCSCGCKRQGAKLKTLDGKSFRLALCHECQDNHTRFPKSAR